MYLKTSNLKFSAYGTEGNYIKPKGYTETVIDVMDDTEIDCFFISNEPVYLKLINGIGLIVVSHDCDYYESFSFYRPIILKPGIAFNFICISGDIEYQAAYLSLRKEKSRNKIIYSKIRHNIVISEIIGYYYHIRNPKYELLNEVHDFWEIYFIDYGQIIMEIDDKPFILLPNNFIFFAPYQKCSISTKILNKPCSYMKILFRANIRNCEMLKNHIFTLTNNIRKLLEHYIKISDRNHFTDDDLMLAYLQLMISQIIREQSHVELFDKSLENPLQAKYDEEMLNSILMYIEKNIMSPISLKTLCDEFNISKGVLYKCFQTKLGISPIKYINNQRLTLSAKLIKSNDYTITMISQMLGYNSVHYFSRQFKDFYGISPSEYASTIYY